VDVSRQVLVQGEADEVIHEAAADAAAAALDAAIIAGSGSSGQPTGIVNTTGKTTQSGTSLAKSGLESMVKACIDSGARERDLMFIGATDVRQTLSGRDWGTDTGRSLWMNSRVVGIPAIAVHPCSGLRCGHVRHLTQGPRP
jgi:HK97 family phage major capsid protein